MIRVRSCMRCARPWRTMRWKPWCPNCRADLVDTLARERREQERHGHAWDLADVMSAIERWADGVR